MTVFSPDDGGIAGISAACAAAKSSAKVILIERFAVTGGMLTTGGVVNFCGQITECLVSGKSGLEGCRILGDYVLAVDDLRAGRAFEDGVARGTYYLDGHKPDDDKRTYILPRDQLKVPHTRFQYGH